MTHAQLKKYIEKTAVEQDALHEVLIDIALYAKGAASYADLLQMPMARIKLFSERLQKKINGKSDSNVMTPGEISKSPNMPSDRSEFR
jgi:hypothetical protein